MSANHLHASDRVLRRSRLTPRADGPDTPPAVGLPLMVGKTLDALGHALLLRGNRDAADQLYRHFTTRRFRFAPEGCADEIANVLVRMQHGHGRYDGSGSFENYFIAALRKQCATRARSAEAFEPIPVDFDLADPCDPFDEIVRADTRECVASAVERLPDELNQAVTQTLLREQPYSVAAPALGCSPATISRTVACAITLLGPVLAGMLGHETRVQSAKTLQGGQVRSITYYCNDAIVTRKTPERGIVRRRVYKWDRCAGREQHS